MTNYRSPLERICIKLTCLAKADALPLISGMVSGLLAHMYVFTNKLMNADEVTAIFSKGATIDSGRWALELLRYVFPDVSVPWLWGIVTVVLLSIAACVTLRIFGIKHNFLRVLLPALFISFPSVTGLFCFMFTSTSYAVAFLLSVLSVWVFVNAKKRWLAWLAGCTMLVFSVGVYQAYIAIAASYFVILMIRRLLEQEDAAKVLRFGVRCVTMLVVSLVVYYAIAFAAVKLSGGEFLVYAVEQETGILFRVALAYNGFIKALLSGYYGFVDTGLSFIAHIIGVGLCAVLGIREFVLLKDGKKRTLLLLCIILLPLSMNCLFLISNTQIIHSLVLYSFVSLYVFAAVLLERAAGKKLLCIRDVVVICMLMTVISNIFVANKVYLKLHLQYEQAYAFYSGLIDDIYDTESSAHDIPFIIVGEYDCLPEFEQLDTGDLFGPSNDLVNTYTREYFMINYLGYSGSVADDTIRYRLRADERVAQMPAYPNDGYISRVDDCLVIKLG